MWINKFSHSDRRYVGEMLQLIPIWIMAPRIIRSDLLFRQIRNIDLGIMLALVESSVVLTSHGDFHNLLATNVFALLILCFGTLFSVVTHGSVGMGDIKLFAVLSLALDCLQSSISALIIASIVGTFQSLWTRSRSIAFAPALIAGTAIAIALK